jgi:hypothetical protein
MTGSNIDEYELASRDDSAAVVADPTQHAEQTRDDPESPLNVME